MTAQKRSEITQHCDASFDRVDSIALAIDFVHGTKVSCRVSYVLSSFYGFSRNDSIGIGEGHETDVLSVVVLRVAEKVRRHFEVAWLNEPPKVNRFRVDAPWWVYRSAARCRRGRGAVR